MASALPWTAQQPSNWRTVKNSKSSGQGRQCAEQEHKASCCEENEETVLTCRPQKQHALCCLDDPLASSRVLLSQVGIWVQAEKTGEAPSNAHHLGSMRPSTNASSTPRAQSWIRVLGKDKATDVAVKPGVTVTLHVCICWWV